MLLVNVSGARDSGKTTLIRELIARLNEAAVNSAVLVSAPAGYGKSTLVSQWVEMRDGARAWVSLDPTESNLVEFVRYLTAAIVEALPGACPVTSDLLRAGAAVPESVLKRMPPDSKARLTESMSSSPVAMMMGMVRNSRRMRSWRQTSKPSIPGICKSRTITSKSSTAVLWTASTADMLVVTCMSRFRMRSASVSRNSSSMRSASSTASRRRQRK